MKSIHIPHRQPPRSVTTTFFLRQWAAVSIPAATAMSADAEESDLNTPYFFPDERPVRFTLEVFPHSGEREPAVDPHGDASACCLGTRRRKNPGSTKIAPCSSQQHSAK